MKHNFLFLFSNKYVKKKKKKANGEERNEFELN